MDSKVSDEKFWYIGMEYFQHILRFRRIIELRRIWRFTMTYYNNSQVIFYNLILCNIHSKINCMKKQKVLTFLPLDKDILSVCHDFILTCCHIFFYFFQMNKVNSLEKSVTILLHRDWHRSDIWSGQYIGAKLYLYVLGFIL